MNEFQKIKILLKKRNGNYEYNSDDFKLIYKNGNYEIKDWNVNKLGFKPTQSELNKITEIELEEENKRIYVNNIINIVDNTNHIIKPKEGNIVYSKNDGKLMIYVNNQWL